MLAEPTTFDCWYELSLHSRGNVHRRKLDVLSHLYIIEMSVTSFVCKPWEKLFWDFFLLLSLFCLHFLPVWMVFSRPHMYTFHMFLWLMICCFPHSSCLCECTNRETFFNSVWMSCYTRSKFDLFRCIAFCRKNAPKPIARRKSALISIINSRWKIGWPQSILVFCPKLFLRYACLFLSDFAVKLMSTYLFFCLMDTGFDMNRIEFIELNLPTASSCRPWYRSSGDHHQHGGTPRFVNSPDLQVAHFHSEFGSHLFLSLCVSSE